MAKGIEDKLLISNASKGKGCMLFGRITMVGGIVYGAFGIWNYLAETAMNSNDFENMKENLIAAGVTLGIGYGINAIGKIKNWYYN